MNNKQYQSILDRLTTLEKLVDKDKATETEPIIKMIGLGFPQEQTKDFFSALRENRTLEAIRLFRVNSAAGLLESKFFVDSLLQFVAYANRELLLEDNVKSPWNFIIATEKIFKHLEEGDTTEAIRSLRETTGCDLKSAKDFVDRIRQFAKLEK